VHDNVTTFVQAVEGVLGRVGGFGGAVNGGALDEMDGVLGAVLGLDDGGFGARVNFLTVPSTAVTTSSAA